MPKGHYPFIICTAPHQRDLLHRPSSTFVAHLNCASLYGLSLLTFGRECDLRIARSGSSAGTGLDVIEVPRSAWMACGAVPPLRRTASLMKSFASSPSSVACTPECTAHREKISIITYRW